MSNPSVQTGSRRRAWVIQGSLILITATLTFLLTALLTNIMERKREAQQVGFKLVNVDEDTVDPAIWGQNFPRQYDSYRRTVDTVRTRYGGSEAFSRLDLDPRLKRIFAGYAFSIDYREERGHAYMLQDQDETERVKKVKQPGACVHCHASVIPTYRKVGNGDVMKGFETVCAMPWDEARKMVTHPVSCVDCHDSQTMQLRVSRPGFLVGIKALARSETAVPHLTSIERWRKGDRKQDYDVNHEATRQEMRSFICGQCHVEYYFKPENKLLTYPWYKGIKVEEIESYYDEIGFKDWTHKETNAPVLKAQHPEFETWNQGIHARSGVACADCHMPYKREGAIKVSDHHVRSPLLEPARACQTCHRQSEQELVARAETIQGRTQALLNRAEDALVQMMDAFQAAQKRGVPEASLEAARQLHRKAQWRMDFVAAENSMGFHADQETARILGEAIDFARQGQIKVLEAR